MRARVKSHGESMRNRGKLFMVLYFSIFPFFSSICSIEFLKARAYRISTRLKDIKKLINLNIIKSLMRWDKLENNKNLDLHL